ncbi:hypothetical protein [Burkholderia anthina]|uniref:hypothetical protein n=1 Tax=Burkholderia anthina TaxID=179879 RepID=UPI001AA0801C|nr:hypothetical protein [Burkholderia anthina]QTD91759.1 hypothetical protein J4G50_26250 [Burkholderia anthina]
MLNRQQILAASDLQSVDVPVPEWGGTVRVLMMSGTARDALQAQVVDNKSTSKFEAALIVATVVDDNGAPLFTVDDVAALQGKSSAALSRVSNAAMKLNRLGEKATEDAEKNSGATPSDGSGTA